MNPNPNLENKLAAKEEIIYLTVILSHLNERIINLTPGINCTLSQYKALRCEKIELTLRLKAARLRSRGCTFVEETDTIYACNNIVLKLGGIYKQKLRA